MTSELLDTTPAPAERESLVRLVRDFAQARVAPRVQEYDACEELPADLLREMADGAVGW